MNKITIGIDISKQKFDVAYKNCKGKWQQRFFENNSKGFEAFVKWLNLPPSTHVHHVMEATGRYGEDLAFFLYSSSHSVSVINPLQIKNYGRSLLIRSKILTPDKFS